MSSISYGSTFAPYLYCFYIQGSRFEIFAGVERRDGGARMKQREVIGMMPK